MLIWNNIALIPDDSHFTKWVQEAGRLDYHEGMIDRVRPFLKGTVLDIGANIGTQTIAYAKHAELVYAFEPLPQAFECLQYNIRNFRNIRAFHQAVGLTHRFTGMEVSVPNYGASYTNGEGTIEVITIDSLNLDDCSFIKMDVEGDEIEVLAGAIETIKEFKPTMLIECNRGTLARKGYSDRELLLYVLDLGYEIEDYQNLECCDILCVPRK